MAPLYYCMHTSHFGRIMVSLLSVIGVLFNLYYLDVCSFYSYMLCLSEDFCLQHPFIFICNSNGISGSSLQALKELSDWVQNAQTKMKDHQKILRNLMIPDIAIKILQTDHSSSYLSISEDEEIDVNTYKQIRFYQRVFKACYQLLKVYLKGQSR